MWRLCLIAIAAFHYANGLVMWFAPHFWYETVPGVAMMGPFNLHFIRDIALVFGMSAGAHKPTMSTSPTPIAICNVVAILHSPPPSRSIARRSAVFPGGAGCAVAYLDFKTMQSVQATLSETSN